MDSVSQKHHLFAEHAQQLQQRGKGRLHSLMLIASQTTVSLKGEWLEALWCNHCQQTKWYYVRKNEQTYEVSIAPLELWQQANGVIHPHGNPSVSEFTRRQSRMLGGEIKDFRWIK